MKTWLAEISERMDDFRFDKIKIYFWWNDFSQPFFGFLCVLAPGSNLQGEIESGTLPKKGSAPSYLSAMYTEFILLVGAPLSTFAWLSLHPRN